MSRTSSALLGNLNWVIAANAVSGVANFLAIAWFARVLGPSTIGDYALVVTAIQLIAAVVSAGFDQAIIRMPHDPELGAAAAVATVLQSAVLVCGTACAYLYLLVNMPDDSSRVGGPAALIFAAIVVSLFGSLVAAPIAAEMDYRFLSVARLASTLSGLSAGVAVTVAGGGLYSLACRDFVITVLFLVFCIIGRRNRLSWSASRAGFKRLCQFAKGLWALNVVERLLLRIDYGIVGVLLGKDLLGAYFVIRGLVEGALGFLVHPIQTVLYAHYCRGRDDSEGSERNKAGVGYIYAAACAVLAAVALVVAPTAITYLLGTAYLHASAIVPGLVIYAGATLWFENAKVLAMSQHMHHRLVHARLVQLVTFLLLVVPCVRFLEVLGASIATAIGGIALCISASQVRKTVQSQ